MNFLTKYYKYIIIGLVLILFFSLGYNRKQDETSGRRSTTVVTENTFSFSTLDITSTTTSATVNKMALPANTSRRYVLITNDSDTVVYLYPSYFLDESAASTTLMYNQGIRVNANGGTYEINYDNPYLGQLWLATTTADKKLLIIEQ